MGEGCAIDAADPSPTERGTRMPSSAVRTFAHPDGCSGSPDNLPMRSLLISGKCACRSGREASIVPRFKTCPSSDRATLLADTPQRLFSGCDYLAGERKIVQFLAQCLPARQAPCNEVSRPSSSAERRMIRCYRIMTARAEPATLGLELNASQIRRP